MAFPPVRTEKLNDFVLAVLNDISKREPEDLVTPQHPLWKRMDQNEVKTIERRPPGKGPVEDVLYQAPDRSIEISLSQDMKDKEFTPIEGYTQAKFDWVIYLQTLTIPMAEYLNSQGKNAIVDIVKRKKRQLDVAYRNKMVSYLWSGAVSGSEVFWGVNDAVKFDPTTEPEKGAVGRIEVSGLPGWANVSKNYDDSYKVLCEGGNYETMEFNGDDSLFQTWYATTQNAEGDGAEGQPDLMPCNATFYQYFADLVSSRLIFTNKADNFNLGVDGFWFRSGTIFPDSNVPDDPNTSTYGVALMLNSRSFSFCFAEGIERKWESMYKLQTKTGFAWDRLTQCSMTWRNRAKNAVFYGVQDKGTKSLA
jgi:hypothetical protein